MDQTESLVKKIVEGLQEKKGKKIATIDLTKFDFGSRIFNQISDCPDT